MKLLSPILKVQLFLLFFLFSSHVFSQDTSINLSIKHNDENWDSSTDGPLPLCSGVSTLEMIVDNQGNNPVSGTLQLSGPSNVEFVVITMPQIDCDQSISVNEESSDVVFDGQVSVPFLEIELTDFPSNTCSIEFEFGIACSTVDNDGSSPLIVVTSSGFSIAAEPLIVDIIEPALLMQNFRDHMDQVLPQASDQNLALQQDASRKYDIKCTGGFVERFQLEISPETELFYNITGDPFTDFTAKPFINGVAGNEIFIHSSNFSVNENVITLDSYSIDQDIIESLFGGVMTDQDYIEIKESFDVVHCSQTAFEWLNCMPLIDSPESRTEYDLYYVCDYVDDGNSSSINRCATPANNGEPYRRNVQVHSAYSDLRPYFTITYGESCSVGGENCLPNSTFEEMDMCGNELKNLVFHYTNLIPNGSGVNGNINIPNCDGENELLIDESGALGSGMKRIEYVTFPLNFTWFAQDQGGTGLVSNPSDWEVHLFNPNDLSEEAIVIHGSETPVEYDEIFTIDVANNRCTLHVNLIEEGVSVPSFQDLYPFNDGENSDIHFEQDLVEGGRFAIEFRNMLFQCNEGAFFADEVNLAFDPDGVPIGFNSCHQSNVNYMPLRVNGYPFRYRYLNMNMIDLQGAQAQYPDEDDDLEPMHGEWAIYRTANSLSMSTSAVANPTDLVDDPFDPNFSSTLEFFYSSATDNSPFEFTTQGYGPFVSCEQESYHLEIQVPTIFDLGISQGDPIEYYQNPDDYYNGENPIILDVSLDGEVGQGGEYCQGEDEGAAFTTYILTASGGDFEIGKNGMVLLKVSLNSEECESTCFGFESVFLKVVATCDDCSSDESDGCPYTLACIENELYYHCDGPCCTQIGTDRNSFKFDRVNLGWTNSTMQARVEASNADLLPSEGGVVVNRCYPSDIIMVNCSGVVAPDAEGWSVSNDNNNGTLEIVSNCAFTGDDCDLEELFFMIEYEPNYELQFFKFHSATFHIDYNDEIEPSIDLEVEVEDIEGFDGNISSPPYQLKIYIHKTDVDDAMNDQIFQKIRDLGAAISFEGLFTVSDYDEITGAGSGIWNLTPNYNPGQKVFSIQQIRAQFAGMYSDENCELGSSSEESLEVFSCDSWGDNMTVINIGTVVNNMQIHNTGLPDGGGFPDLGLCGNTFRLGSYVRGGIPAFDEFPNEFRPVMLWPNTVLGFDLFNGSQIQLEYPADVFSPSSEEGDFVLGNAAGFEYSDVDVEHYQNTMIFEGNDVNGFSLFYDEIEGHNNLDFLIQYEIPTFNSLDPSIQNCITAAEDLDYSLYFPIIERAYAIEDMDANYAQAGDFSELRDFNVYSTELNENDPLYTSGEMAIADVNVNFNGPVETINLVSSEGSINVISISKQTGEGIGNMAIDNVWIAEDHSGHIDITGVRTIQNGLIVEATPFCDNYWNLGSIGNEAYNLEVDYSIIDNSDLDCGELALKFDFGHTCFDIIDCDDVENLTCEMGSFEMPMQVVESNYTFSELSKETSLPFCDEHFVTVELNCPSQADVENPEICIEVNEEYQIEWRYALGENDFNSEWLPLGDGPDCVGGYIDLNSSELFNGEGMPGSVSDGEDGDFNDARIQFKIIGSCGLVDSQQNIEMTLYGETVCYDEIYSDGISLDIILNFESGQDCEDCNEHFCMVIDNPNEQQYPLEDEGVAVLPYTTYAGDVPQQWTTVLGNMRRTEDNVDFYISLLNQYQGNELGFRLGEATGAEVDRLHAGFIHDNMLYVVGETHIEQALLPANIDVFVAKINLTNGVLEWARGYGNEFTNIGKDILYVQEIEENRLIVAGQTVVNESGRLDVFALKLNSETGEIEGLNTYKPVGKERSMFVEDMIQIQPTKRVAIVGYHGKDPAFNAFAMMIENDLNVVLPGMTDFGSNGIDKAFGITQLGSKLYVTGYTDKLDNRDQVFIAELNQSDLTGTGVSKIFESEGEYSSSHGNKIISFSDEGVKHLVVSGYHKEHSHAADDGLLFRVKIDDQDPNYFDLAWTKKTIGWARDVHLGDLAFVPANDHLIVAGTVQAGQNDNDIYLLNLDPLTGETGIVDDEGIECCTQDHVQTIDGVLKFATVTLESDFEYWYNSGDAIKEDSFQAYYHCPDSRNRSVHEQHSSIAHASYTIFPNPNSGTFTVELEDPEDVLKKITLLDLAGREIIRQEFEENDKGLNAFTMSTNVLRSGVYILRVESEGDQGMSRISIMR